MSLRARRFQWLPALIGMLTVGNASASVIELDLVQGSDDRYLTRDTIRQVDWLDLPLTAGLSMNQIAAGAGGWIANGFRWAAMSEVRSLFGEFGVLPGSFTVGPAIAGAQSLIGFLGYTHVNNPPSPGNLFGQRTTWGITADHFTATIQPDDREFAMLTASDSFAAFEPVGQMFVDRSDNLVGHFLVRNVPAVDAIAVPLPSSLGLAIAGLMAMVRARSRLRVDAGVARG